MSTGFITPSLPQGLSSLALRISSFCAKGTRSNSNSTPKSPRATMSASDFAMMPSMLVKASLWGQKGVWVRRLGEDLKILGPAPSPFRTNKLWKVTFLHGFLYQKTSSIFNLHPAGCPVSKPVASRSWGKSLDASPGPKVSKYDTSETSMKQ